MNKDANHKKMGPTYLLLSYYIVILLYLTISYTGVSDPQYISYFIA